MSDLHRSIRDFKQISRDRYFQQQLADNAREANEAALNDLGEKLGQANEQLLNDVRANGNSIRRQASNINRKVSDVNNNLQIVENNVGIKIEEHGMQIQGVVAKLDERVRYAHEYNRALMALIQWLRKAAKKGNSQAEELLRRLDAAPQLEELTK